MGLTDAVKTEVFRPIASIGIPGAIAVAPYVIVAQHYVPRVLEFWKEHDTAFTSTVVGCMLAAGLLLEDLGALFETRVIDRYYDRKNPEHSKNWERYLQLQIKDEYVGQRYLRTMVTRLKFELSMMPAMLALWIGLLWVQLIHDVWTSRAFVVLSVFLLAVAGYLLCEAFWSANTLAITRRLLIEAVEGKYRTRQPNERCS